MSQARVCSGQEGLNPFKSFVLDNKSDRLRWRLKFGVVVLFAVSALVVIYSAFTSEARWFRCAECRDFPAVKIAPAPGCAVPEQNDSDAVTDVSHIVFGIGGSINTWKNRKHYSELWWKPNITRGFVWLDAEPDPAELWPETSPPYRISSDWKKFKFIHSLSAVRLSRIVVDSFREGLPDARWFVMGDDDTVFFPENLAAVLAKYDHREMYYVGGNSESVEQDAMHAYDMAFGGGGFAISYPLAAELVKIMDGCLNRYFYFYGSDQRVWACVGELGVSLTRELGFHQIDIRGDPFGLLAAHPVAPLVSLHHLDDVNPLFPNQTQLDSLRTITEAYKMNPARIMQQSFCYWKQKWSVSVSWGYAVQIYPQVLTPKELEMPLQTFHTWRSWSNGPFIFNVRPVSPDPCQQPVVFYLDSVEGAKKGEIVTTYKKFVGKVQKKCNTGAVGIEKVVVSAGKMDHDDWKQIPRRQCCEVSKGFWSSTMNVKIRKCKHQEAIIPGG
ncbi:PREDICTED: uncharacterized protein LOC109186749 [Ipomoea nil]|uniref:uncharacterized protein LOC109186749 n=1 Tax=Ipomoea nil TaxID=35883 RepID=UPI000901E17B|nr:PREDICTED: uncharacterized protein LOC109186749 [Ipomoea nil]